MTQVTSPKTDWEILLDTAGRHTVPHAHSAPIGHVSVFLFQHAAPLTSLLIGPFNYQSFEGNVAMTFEGVPSEK